MKPKTVSLPATAFMKHIQPLDSLRGIAVCLVIVSHWLPARHFLNKVPNGAIGVDIFFVLSGFLITTILLQNRNKAEELSISKTVAFKNFFFRRALRIFPIYYLTIYTLFIFHDFTGTSIQSSFIYYLTYTSNFYFYQQQRWDGMVSHFWSLAVEEQFYLFWPWIMLLVNKKFMLPVIVGFIAVGIGSQYMLRHMELGDIFTTSCFDAFGLGALLSWITIFKPTALVSFYKIVCWFALACFILFIVGVIQQQWIYIPLRTLVSVVALWMITYIVKVHREHKQVKLSFVLNNRLLLFIGKISYGVYVYHRILPSFTKDVLNNYCNSYLGLTGKYNVYVLFIENFILLMAIAWLSWNVIESPFLKLKKYFTYNKWSFG